MPPKIKKLPEDVKCLLRSELAIISIAQCVEELVLNAIDSACSNIAVRLDLDIFKITVVDDGDGICEDGLNILGSRYVTSKCNSIKDLETNLIYFGYRGEALASIILTSAIVEVISRAKTNRKTYSKLFLYGKSNDVSVKDVTRPSFGTTVSITDFMYNLPVRRKLIKPTFDIESCRKRLECIALVHPHVSFSLSTDKNKSIIFKTKRRKSSVDIYNQLYGHQMKDHLSEVDYFVAPFRVVGFVSKKSHHSKSLQLIYVNKRPVFNKKILSLINNLLSRSSIFQRKSSSSDGISPSISPSNIIRRQYCLFMINIICPYDKYDITFEPKKSMVDFINMDKLLETIEQALLCFIKQENLTIQQEKKAEETGLNSIVDMLPTEDILIGRNQTAQNKLSVFASKFKSKPADVGSLESLPARRKDPKTDICLISIQNKKTDVTNETVMCTETSDITLAKSSIQLFKEQIENCVKLTNAPLEGNASRHLSSLDAFKKKYFSCQSKKEHYQSPPEHILPSKKSSLLDITTNRRYSSKSLVLSEPNCELKNSYLSQSVKLIKQKKKMQPTKTKQKFDGATGLDKSFYFNPQIPSVSPLTEMNEEPIIKFQNFTDTSSNYNAGEVMLKTGNTNNPKILTSTGNYFNDISYPNEVIERNLETKRKKIVEPLIDFADNLSIHQMTMKCKDDANLFDAKSMYIRQEEYSVEPEATSVTNDRSKSDISLDSMKLLEDYNTFKDNNGRQVYINKDTGNSTYIQPSKRADPIWKKNISMGESIQLVSSFGYQENSSLKRFSLSHGQRPDIKRKYPVENCGVVKYLKASNIADTSLIIDAHKKSDVNFENGRQMIAEDLLDKWKHDELLRMQEILKTDSIHMLTNCQTIDSNAIYEPTTNCSLPCYKISQPYKLEKSILQQAKVIGQVDKKFISITVPYDCSPSLTGNATEHNLLVLLDQHAADERVQLEKILDENYESTDGKENIRWSVIDPAFQLEFEPGEARLLADYEEIFESFGLYYIQIESTVYEFTAIPSILVAKDSSEKNTRRCQLAHHTVELTVKAICATISTLRGSSVDFKERRPLPQPLAYIFNTFACKAAIKFGDLLTVEECRLLLDSLSKCRLPFQCAHGRPSVYPVMEFGHLSNKTSKEKKKINLNKLQKLK